AGVGEAFDRAEQKQRRGQPAQLGEKQRHRAGEAEEIMDVVKHHQPERQKLERRARKPARRGKRPRRCLCDVCRLHTYNLSFVWDGCMIGNVYKEILRGREKKQGAGAAANRAPARSETGGKRGIRCPLFPPTRKQNRRPPARGTAVRRGLAPVYFTSSIV